MDNQNVFNLSAFNDEKGNKGHVVSKTKSDEMELEEMNMILEANNKISGMPIFNGEPAILHAYESDLIKVKTVCPRCKAETKQMLSHFAYATHVDPRIMSGPAGHFCTACPTVIIDEEVVRFAIRGNYEYGGVFSIVTDNTTFMFETINGKKATYVVNGLQQDCGILESMHYIESEEDANDRFIYVSKSEYDSIHNADFSKPQVKMPQLSAAAQAKKKAKAKAAKKARKQHKK